MNEGVQRVSRAGQRGASLLTSLILLAAIMLLGATTAGITVQGEKAARNERDFRLAFFAAEAALRDAQADMDRDDEREKAVFLPVDAAMFIDGCGTAKHGKSHGLCAPALNAKPPAWITADLLATGDEGTPTVALGTHTGRSFPTGDGSLPARLPRYLIELLDATGQELTADDKAIHAVYRITAVGFGMRSSTHVVLQAVYRRDRIPNEAEESKEEPPYHYRSRRLSWREIPHWQELHDAIKKK